MIERSCGRLRTLTHRLLAGDRVRRLEETDDVLHGAVIRLREALGQIPPATLDEYLRLAAFHIRRELFRLGRHYYGANGWGANVVCRPDEFQDHDGVIQGLLATDPSPSQQAAKCEEWEQLHAQIEALPQEQRDVVDLVWLHGLSHDEAAVSLGVSERTIRRRWVRARLTLHHALAALGVET